MARPEDIPATIPELMRRAAQCYGERIAIQEDGLRLSYAALDAGRIQAARALMALGVQPGDRVAVWAPNFSEWIVAALATHSVGAALVPLNTRMKGAEAGAVLADSGARLLFCVDDFLGESYPRMLAPHRPATLERLVILRPGHGRAPAGDELRGRTSLRWRGRWTWRRSHSAKPVCAATCRWTSCSRPAPPGGPRA